MAGELIESFLRLGRQIVPVEAELHRCLGDGVIVIQVGDRVGQHADASVRSISDLLRLLRVLGSDLRLLLDFSGLRVHRLDAGLRARVNVFDIARILRSQVVQFVGLVDQWRRLILHIVFADAADGGHHAGCQANH